MHGFDGFLKLLWARALRGCNTLSRCSSDEGRPISKIGPLECLHITYQLLKLFREPEFPAPRQMR
jgi:hypothetical protein